MFSSRMGGGLGGSAKEETTTFLTEAVVSCLLKHFRTRKNRSSVSRSRNQLSREIIGPQTVQNKFDCLVFDMLFIKELTSLLDAESNLSCAQFLRWHPFVKSSTFECFIITLLTALTLRNFFIYIYIWLTMTLSTSKHRLTLLLNKLWICGLMRKSCLICQFLLHREKII